MIKKWKQLLAGTLALGMVLSTAAGGRKAIPVQAQEPSGEESEWEELSAILDSYPGIYTEPSPISNYTEYMADGPLMGNGTVYAFMGGDRKVQKIFISRSNMWKSDSSTTFGGITVQKYNADNLALGKTVTANDYIAEGQKPSLMVDGAIDTKWCTVTPQDGRYWAMIDLEKEEEISRWVVKHAQAGGEGADWNTSDFKLQYSTEENPDGARDEDWIDADIVQGNTEAVTDRTLGQPITSRYVRLVVTKPTNTTDPAVRIYEVELYQKPTVVEDGENYEFRYEQDMRNSEVFARSEDGFESRSWLSAKENILVTEIKNITGSELTLRLDGWAANEGVTAGISEDGIMYASKSASFDVNEVNVTMATQVLDSEVTASSRDERTNTAIITLAADESVTVISAIEGGKNTALKDSQDQAIAKVKQRNTSDALKQANDAHRDWWREYWLKSYINIEDEDVERMYYGMLYALGCATSSSSENNSELPPALFPWSAANAPAWNGYFTTNTDEPRQVHPLIQANRLDNTKNYTKLIEDYWPKAQKRAADPAQLNLIVNGQEGQKGCGGPTYSEGFKDAALFPVQIGPWGYSPHDLYWGQPSDASSMLMPLIKEWQYTRDETFLKDWLYPKMRDVACFWEQWVKEENGQYILYGATHEMNGGKNAIFDICATKYILSNTIEAAKELNVDSDKITKWHDILDNLVDVPTMEYNGKTIICDVEGRTQSNPGKTFDGNPVTIQSIYYFDAIGMSASEEEKEKYTNYLDATKGNASHRRLISATRLGYDIKEIMDDLKKSMIAPEPGDWAGLRGNNTAGDIGAAAAISVIQDSLLQSNEEFLNIFANWYDDQAASFRRMRANGAFLVDAAQNEFGQVTYVNILSEKGRDCSVLNPWPGMELEVYEDGKKIEIKNTEENSLGTVYTFATKANANYELKSSGDLQDILKLSDEKLDMMAGSTEKLSAVTNIENAGIIWTSSDMEVAIVGNDGSVLALKEGTAEITASVPGKQLSAKCVVTVTKNVGINVAPYGTATSNSHLTDFIADRAISGTWNYNYEGWVSENESWDNANGRWLQIDLREEYTIERWVLKLDGHRQQKTDDPVGDPNDASNWGDYYLQVSEDGINDWKTLDFKKDNKTNTIDQTLDKPVTGRYFRIYMEFPMFKSDAGWEWPSGYARLNQVELYEVPRAIEEVKATELQQIAPMETAFGTAFATLSLPEKVTVKLSNDMFVDFPVSWNKGTYNENKSGEYTLNGTLQLPASISNPNNLTATVTVKVNAPITAKEVLQKTYDYALKLNTEGATDSAKAYFEKALANAKAVLENPDATEEVINKAWDDLVDAIHELGVAKGDLTYLKLLIDKAESMIAAKDKYVDTNWQKLVDELFEAKAVYASGDARQEDIDKAVDELLEAIKIQRYKANKDNLKELIEKADKMDLSGYTKESVEVFKDALAEAKIVMADESLSVDDQKKVDLAEKELNDAIQNLVKASDGDDNSDNGNTGDEDNTGDDGNTGNGGNTGNDGNPGDSGDTGNGSNTGDTDNKGTTSDKGDAANAGKTDTPKTGDAFSVMFWIRAMLLAGLGTACVIIRRRVSKR